ncbi:thiamine biosynthesis protein ApbE [Sinomonas atrocyanea]|uniref:FAD:protein FMN transferase n=2 Tax=Sinomonas atrocyanea TaxID=37927 RepID=A0A127A509_9MICC|nr:thiamine biosynthesis protein ApbE [Sinomonas atrocyanea]GEB64734.1 FAD:protein FMN transferase [Sinomonas atrocyanea]
MQPISDPIPALPAPGTAAPGTPALRARTFVCMGTVVSLTVPVRPGDGLQADLDRLEAATAVVEDQFAALDAQFSLYRPDSEASRIARGELTLLQASPLMRDLYADAVRWRRRTEGAFTPERPDGLLDLSGLVKGYAIDEAGRSLAALGLHDWCLNAGGDVLVSGSPAPSPAGASPWLAGIVDPADRRTLLGAYPLGPQPPARLAQPPARLALATSGSAERGDHIWTVGLRGPSGPRHAEFTQVSVAAQDIVTADVLATAIVAGGRPALDAVTAHWDVDVLAVARDGGLLATPGFRAPSAA